MAQKPLFGLQETEKRVIISGNKRMLSEVNTDDQEAGSSNYKVSDLSVNEFKSLLRQGNDEILHRLDYITGDVLELKKQNDELKKEMENLKAEKEADRKRITQLEDKFKSKNLIFKGVAAGNSANIEVQKICNKILETPDPTILKSAKKLYEHEGKVTVLAELDSEQSAINVLKNTKKLAGTKIYIERDLNEERQKDKRALLRLKKEILNISKFHRIVVRDDKMRIAEKWFKWNADKKIVCGQDDAGPIMKQIYGEKISSINLDYEYLLNKSNSKN